MYYDVIVDPYGMRRENTAEKWSQCEKDLFAQFTPKSHDNL